MSKHWKPDEDIAWIRAESYAPERRRGSWPAGATAGVALVAVCCLGVAAALYHLAGPRDVFGP